MNPKYNIGDILAVPAVGGEITALIINIDMGHELYETLDLINNKEFVIYFKDIDPRWTVRKLA